jgi:hypothetical protein
MASVITATSITNGLMACGGFHDHKGLAATLAAAAGYSPVTVTGGGTLSVNQVAFVLDGQGVTLPAAPANGSVIVVVCGTPSTPVTVTAGSGDTVAGMASMLVSMSLPFTYASGTKIWSV